MLTRCRVRVVQRGPFAQWRSWLHCIVACLLLAPGATWPWLDASAASPSEAPPARRVVSLNPSLTAIILALGARDSLVGVDDFSARQQSDAKGIPTVGGLFNPSLESVVALRPDLVVLVPSVEQRDFRRRLEALGIRVSVFANIRLAEVLENIARLGSLVGREAQARARLHAVTEARKSIERETAGRHRPRTVLILQREPIFIVGSGSFIDEMLRSAGGDNLGSEFDEAYPRVAAEWLVAAAPEVLIDFSPEALAGVAYWERWPSLPAVQNGRVLAIEPEQVTLPGPYLDRALGLLAGALHGTAVRDAAAASSRAAASSQDGVAGASALPDPRSLEAAEIRAR
jgi:iron complex transport system substrate-binding protein